MRAVVIREFGGEDVLELTDVADPAPGAGEVLIRVAAIEVSRTRDVATRTGMHPFSKQVSLPHILGGDFAGTVEEVGPGVDSSLAGRRVVAANTQTCGECAVCRAGHEERCQRLSMLGIHRPGSYAELAVVEAAVVSPIPDDLSMTAAAAMAADGPIAMTQLEVAGVNAGTTLLVTGATGALGSTLAALAGHLNAEVFGLSRRPAEIPASLPMAARIDANDPQLAATLLEASRGGLEAVADNVAAPQAFAGYFPALAVGARVVFSGAIGTPELPILPVPAGPLYRKSISLLGVATSPLGDRRRFWGLVGTGFRLPPGLVQTFPLDRVREAHAKITAGSQLGHTVLTV